MHKLEGGAKVLGRITRTSSQLMWDQFAVDHTPIRWLIQQQPTLTEPHDCEGQQVSDYPRLAKIREELGCAPGMLDEFGLEDPGNQDNDLTRVEHDHDADLNLRSGQQGDWRHGAVRRGDSSRHEQLLGSRHSFR